MNAYVSGLGEGAVDVEEDDGIFATFHCEQVWFEGVFSFDRVKDSFILSN